MYISTYICLLIAKMDFSRSLQKTFASSGWEVGIEGNFPIHKAVVEGKHAPYRQGIDRMRPTPPLIVMPRGTKVLSAYSYGVSSWTKTGKVSVILPGGDLKRYIIRDRLA